MGRGDDHSVQEAELRKGLLARSIDLKAKVEEEKKKKKGKEKKKTKKKSKKKKVISPGSRTWDRKTFARTTPYRSSDERALGLERKPRTVAEFIKMVIEDEISSMKSFSGKPEFIYNDFSGYDISDLDINKIREEGREKFGAEIIKAPSFLGSNFDDAKLCRSSIRSCVFSNCSMKRVDLSDSDISFTNFINSNLNDADLSECTGENAFLAGAKCRRINGQNSDFRDAIFWGTDLRDADLRGADLRGADFRGANTDGIKLSGARTAGAIGLKS